MIGTVKRFWKPVVFVALNLVFIASLGVILETLLRVLRGEDPLALLGIFAADIVFLVVGILLMTLNNYYRCSLISRLLPFIAILVLTLVAFLNVTTVSLWFGLVATVVIIFGSVAATLSTLITTRKSN